MRRNKAVRILEMSKISVKGHRSRRASESLPVSSALKVYPVNIWRTSYNNSISLAKLMISLAIENLPMITFLTDSIPVVGMGMSLLRVQVGLSSLPVPIQNA